MKNTGNDKRCEDYRRWPMPPRRSAPTARLVGYARVSTEDQKLDLQLDALTRAGCDDIFHDHGVSGAKAERPGLDAALKSLVEGDTLVVYKLDRLGRSVLHLADLITRLDDDCIQFCSLTEGIDTATPGGKLVFHVFAAVAEFSRNLIRENTVAGINAARTRGVKIGRPRRMTDDDVMQAHALIHNGGMTYAQAARLFRVSQSTILREFHRLTLLPGTV